MPRSHPPDPPGLHHSHFFEVDVLEGDVLPRRLVEAARGARRCHDPAGHRGGTARRWSGATDARRERAMSGGRRGPLPRPCMLQQPHGGSVTSRPRSDSPLEDGAIAAATDASQFLELGRGQEDAICRGLWGAPLWEAPPSRRPAHGSCSRSRARAADVHWGGAFRPPGWRGPV